MRTLIAGNWKMNGSRAMLAELDRIAEAASAYSDVDVAIAPPFTLLGEAQPHAGRVWIGGQDCHRAAQGAHTGCISAGMLVEMGARFVICGHSERRAEFGETDPLIRAKAEAAQAAGLIAIVCIGEDEHERDEGRAVEVVACELDGSVPPASTPENLVVSYEPAWAIGTGRIPTFDQICEIHSMIRAKLIQLFGEAGVRIRILYGGSVNAGNAASILACPHVNGALIGGASLTADQFVPIVEIAANVSQ
ncbi:MAG TPA: triose-phosphate isomerase [Sphingomonas sp.]|uniref:triose-phosphate isomerase n=1 Tax=Sphingomonas sp. TaxID=28214 RepID=UPI002C53731C|nr:triose-phosphate isomerase [Sphingomonas sp.]HMI20376.1 triose-phosphate isomerase [Sphingomonas sp.]